MIRILKTNGRFGLEHRGYLRASDRERAITMLRKHGYNYFVRYRDTAAPFAIQYCHISDEEQKARDERFRAQFTRLSNSGPIHPTEKYICPG